MQQLQPDIYVAGHQLLLQQHVRVLPTLEVKELTVGDHHPVSHQADIFIIR